MGGTSEGWINLTGQVAAVTGAARGIGRATAGALAAAGAKVILLDRDDVSEAAAETGGTSRNIDVTSEDDWRTAGDWIAAEFGHLDVMVNAAGVVLKDSVGDDSLDTYRTTFDINVAGVLSGMGLALRFMRVQGKGAIVNLSSTASLRSNTLMASYGASKAAVAHYTRSAAMETMRAGHDIRVNAVHPGIIETRMADAVYEFYSHVGPPEVAEKLFTAGRPGKPQEIADLILFLVSDRASYISGASIVADRGANA